jgi:hypothetical protein
VAVRLQVARASRPARDAWFAPGRLTRSVLA